MDEHKSLATRISIELVPRGEEFLVEQLELLKTCFPQANTINIPDLVQFKMRSWEACAVAKRHYSYAVAHIRAIDINLDKPLCMAQELIEHHLDEVVIIAGDPPLDFSRRVYPTTTLDAIRKFKRELPHITVYAGTDPYRQSLRREVEYIKRKTDAGADGFFTQPFYDLRLMEIYAELLAAQKVFWGVSPVLSDKSRDYWEAKNNAIFPRDFHPNLEWNRDFAIQALQFVKTHRDHVYFMPIRANLCKYLTGILE